MKDEVGSVAEEAAKLFAVLQNAASTDDADEGAHRHEHKLGPDCVRCPVCQLIHRVRNTSPETIEQLSTAAAHVLGSLRSLLEAAAEAARQAREDAASQSSRPEQDTTSDPAEDAAQEETRSRVDRIDVSEDPEPWD